MDVVSTVASVGKTIADVATNPEAGILEIPNTILKVIDTSQDVIRNLTESDVKNPVVLDTKADVNTKHNEIIVDKLKQSMPVVNTTAIPSAFRTETSNAPVTVTESFDRDLGRKIVNVSGSITFINALYNASATVIEGRAGRLLPSDSLIFGSRCAQIADTFQLHRINKITAQYVNQQGTSEPGNVFMLFMDGVDTTTAFAPSATLSDFSQREGYKLFSAGGLGQVSIRGKGNWLYMDNYNGDDPHFFSDLMFVFGCIGNTVANVPIAGTITLVFDISFAGAAEASINFLSNVRKSLTQQWLTDVNGLGKYSYLTIVNALAKKAMESGSEVAFIKTAFDRPRQCNTKRELIEYERDLLSIASQEEPEDWYLVASKDGTLIEKHMGRDFYKRLQARLTARCLDLLKLMFEINDLGKTKPEALINKLIYRVTEEWLGEYFPEDKIIDELLGELRGTKKSLSGRLK